MRYIDPDPSINPGKSKLTPVTGYVDPIPSINPVPDATKREEFEVAVQMGLEKHRAIILQLTVTTAVAASTIPLGPAAVIPAIVGLIGGYLLRR